LTFRDAQGHFISREEYERRQAAVSEEEQVVQEPEEPGEFEEAPGGWGAEIAVGGSVYIETGRGQTAQVQAGTPFKEAIERVADEFHYGGYFRVFLNGSEIVDPDDAPQTIEPGMRIALTSYDKVG